MNEEERWSPAAIKELVISAMPAMRHLGAQLPKVMPPGAPDLDGSIAMLSIAVVLLKRGGVSFENTMELAACLYQRSIFVEPPADA